jgi:ABC-type bacteriocin/lantibiotic exporter with double-glycine peptidase domain
VLWFGATQVLALELTVGQLVAAYALMRNTMGSISEVTDSISDFQEGIVASDRLMEMLELQPEPGQARYTTLPPLRRALQVRGLRFGYLPDRPVLSDVTFELPKGSYTVLLGANGSGKSTLAALVTRLIEPQAGHVDWDDLPLAEVSLETLRKNMVYLRQEVPLFYTTLWDNLLLGHSASLEQVETLLSDLGFANVIRRLPEGLQTVIGGESPYRLSTGERQLLGLARALLSEAPVLILDEPTATLDQAREQIVVERLRKLKGKCTLLVITHRPALCEPADQILQLQDGRVQVQARVSR